MGIFVHGDKGSRAKVDGGDAAIDDQRVNNAPRTMNLGDEGSTNKDMEEVRQMFVKLHTSISPGTSQISPSASRSECNSSSRFHFAPRFTKIEFPQFDGEDLKGWLSRYEQFFEVDGTSEDAKVQLVAIHLEGKALKWH